MNSYDSDDYDESTYYDLQSKRDGVKHQALRRLFDTAADRRIQEAQGQRKVTYSSGTTCCDYLQMKVHSLTLRNLCYAVGS